MPVGFLKQTAKVTPVKIGNPETGQLFLASLGFKPVGERKLVDALEAERRKASLLQLKLINKIAKDKKITPEEANELLFPSKSVSLAIQKITLIETLEQGDDLLLITPVTFDILPEQVIKYGDDLVTVKGKYIAGSDAIAIYPSPAKIEANSSGFLWDGKDYIKTQVVSPNQSVVNDVLSEYIEDVTELSSVIGISEIKIESAIATILISKRVLYPVYFVANTAVNSTTIEIEPSQIYLKDRQQIKVGNQVIVVKGNHDINESIINIQPISERISVNDIGFLWDGKDYRKGCEWTDSDTDELDEELPGEIYEFYQKEGIAVVEKTETSTSDNVSEPEELGESPRLTGTNSTGESKDTELAIADSLVTTVS